MTTAIHVSNYFTNKAIKRKNPLMLMQALKYTYIAQQYHLALRDRPFFNEEIRAWKYGPVVVELYEHLKNTTNDNVMRFEQPPHDGFDEEQKEILEVVFYRYNKMGAYTLVCETNGKGSPWRTIIDREPGGVIGHDLMREYSKQGEVIGPYSFAILLDEMRREGE